METRAITNTQNRYDNRQQSTTMNFYNTTQTVMREIVRAIKDGSADDFLRYAKIGMARI
jgi:hypothetical protein